MNRKIVWRSTMNSLRWASASTGILSASKSDSAQITNPYRRLKQPAEQQISIHHSLKLIKLEDSKPALRDEDALNELRAFFGQQRKAIATERKQFDVAHSDFVAKAQRAAGVKLPP